MEASGAIFNAWTDWRTTNYMIINMPISNINLLFKIHKNQVLFLQPIPTSVQLEKGVKIFNFYQNILILTKVTCV